MRSTTTKNFAAVAMVALAALVLSAGSKRNSVGVETVRFASGEVTVVADLHRVNGGDENPLVVLFHQARSNARGEYAAIIPRLIEAGYHVLAVDQRSGGPQFGSSNRTIAELADKEIGYCDAYPDLVNALRYARKAGFSGKIFAWGSSYSAGLLVRLGAEHPDLADGLLLFSPASGPAMKACSPNGHIDALRLPTLALRPSSEMKRDTVRAQLNAFEAAGHDTFVAIDGVHGSSMLDPSRSDGDIEETWQVVLDFLASKSERK